VSISRWLTYAQGSYYFQGSYAPTSPATSCLLQNGDTASRLQAFITHGCTSIVTPENVSIDITSPTEIRIPSQITLVFKTGSHWNVGPNTRITRAAIARVCAAGSNTTSYSQGSYYAQASYTDNSTTTYAQPNYYSQGTYYAQSSYTTGGSCPTVPVQPTCNGTLAPIKDTNGCTTGWNCQLTTTST
jgi:hypothetical protein